MPTRTDVLVIGGGIIGLSAAYRLAADGYTVRVVDASGTRGATWAAAGMLAPISEAVFGEAELTRLNLAAVPAFREFAAELEHRTGSSVGLRTDGTLAVAFNADDRSALDRLTAFRNSLGLHTESLGSRQTRQLEPYLAPDVRAGVLAVDDLSVDNRQYAAVVTDAARSAGVQFCVGEVVSLLPGGGARLADGTDVFATQTVLCAGALSSRLAALPVFPVKGQILRLAVPERLARAGPVLRHTVRGLVRSSEVYLVPRANGEIVVGATQEQQGHDTTVTAGGVYELLRNAYELLPVSSEFTFLEARAGSRPGTADNGPIVGVIEAGLIVATGHYRNGILLSALTATAVGRLVAGLPLAEEWKPFDPRRFD